MSLRVGADLLTELRGLAEKANRGLSDYVRGVLSRHCEEERKAEAAVPPPVEVVRVERGGSVYRGSGEGKR